MRRAEKSAIRASAGVKKISVKIPNTPPTPDDKKLNCKARAASPFCAIRCPSSIVAMLAGAPGILSKIALTAPPATVEV